MGPRVPAKEGGLAGQPQLALRIAIGGVGGLPSGRGNRLRYWGLFAGLLARRPAGFAALILTCAGLAVVGCASPAQPGGMVPEGVPVLAREPRTVNLRAFGGEPTRPLGRSKISNEAFAEALAMSLAQAGLLRAVIDESGDYRLDVTIEEIAQPHFALAMTVRLVTRWVLARRGER